MKITVKYDLGHSLTSTWERTDWFCPHCGKKALYEEQGRGDYYAGQSVVCISCNREMCSGYFPSPAGKYSLQKIEQIKKQVEANHD